MIRPVTYYQIVCDAEGCSVSTWSKHPEIAEYDWRYAGRWSGDGRHLCADHAPTCPKCGWLLWPGEEHDYVCGGVLKC